MTALELAELIVLAIEDDVYVEVDPQGTVDEASVVCEDSAGMPFLIQVKSLTVDEGDEDLD